nr:S-adenosyl-L-methionine-dependent methyltransferases superfamily protein [Tanacetum cinerariifolium]
ALACGPSQTPISVNSCVVNSVRFVVHNRDECRTTQNSGICSPGLDGEMYYDDDIIDEEDPIPHDLADSNDEYLVNLDIDDGVNMSTDVARGHGGDGGEDDRPPPYQ